MGRQKSPATGFSRADLEVFERPTSIVTTRMLMIAVLGLVAYFWMAIVLVSENHEEEDPVRCCGTCAPGAGQIILGSNWHRLPV